MAGMRGAKPAAGEGPECRGSARAASSLCDNSLVGSRLALLLLAFACAAAAKAQPRYAFDTTPSVLPRDVVPSRYALAFDVDPARDTFSGETSIDLRVRRPVASIVLHAHEIDAAVVTLSDECTSRNLNLVA